ncbi:MAG: MBL fold metallo-hydrolase [Candidatus Cloacimonetes bacterium]|nr:MBL fold metallo-hydrolase [Candidatus Cloacimonadota bacterium]
MKSKLFDLLQYFFLELQRTSFTHRLFVLAIITAIPWFIILSWPDKTLHVYFFDVGQGDSVFIKTPDNYQILVDGGPDESVLAELGKVMPFYDRSIDLVFLTHPHADHVSGLIEVLRRFEVGQILVNDVFYETDEYQTFLSLIDSKKILKQNFLQGDKIKLSDGTILQSFWPKAQTSLWEILDVNKVSQVVRLDYGQFSLLLTGDAGLGSENPELANRDWDRVDVLKVPHQGSKGAVTKEVLERLKPKLAVISVGPNKFGHPSEEVVELLSSPSGGRIGQAIRVLRTDEEGTVEVVSNGKNWVVR